MQNIKLAIQYDGTRYLGWQRPENDGYRRTVSYKIKEVLNRMTGEDIILHAGSRPGPGVHALAQTVSFQTEAPLEPADFLRDLNQYLPQDIAVLSAENVPERFRADLNAIFRTYEYRICTEEIYNVFRMKYEAHCFPAPDISLMEEAAGFLKGRHDFRCFSSGRKKKGTEKEILDIRFVRDRGRLTIRITANDFLQRMPELLFGVLLETGKGLRTPGSILDLLDGNGTVKVPLAEAKGILLKDIQY